MTGKELVYQVEQSKNLVIRRNLELLKYLGSSNMASRDVNIDDLLYNLNCLIGYFNALEHNGAAKTIWCAEQALRAAFKYNDND